MRESLGLGSRLAGLLLAPLQAGVIALGELVLKFLDSACRVDVFQFARIERVAIAADIDLQLFSRTPRRKRIATTTGDARLHVVRMDFFLHRFPGSTLPRVSSAFRGDSRR
jgi:hypothetical protein